MLAKPRRRLISIVDERECGHRDLTDAILKVRQISGKLQAMRILLDVMPDYGIVAT